MFLPDVSSGLADKREALRNLPLRLGHLVFLLLSGFLGLPSCHSDVKGGFDLEAPRGRAQLAPISSYVNQGSGFWGGFPSKLSSSSTPELMVE